jgi:hypothetical protein
MLLLPMLLPMLPMLLRPMPPPRRRGSRKPTTPIPAITTTTLPEPLTPADELLQQTLDMKR